MDFKFNFGVCEESCDAPNHNNSEEKLLRSCLHHQYTLPYSGSLNSDDFNKIHVGSNVLYYMKADIAARKVESEGIFPFLQSSDLQSGEYEGGLKLWECTTDLLNYLCVKNFPLVNKNVLDLGCGAGLLGLYSYLNGASNVCLQDYNSEVIEHFTIPSVECTLHNHNTNCKSKKSPKLYIENKDTTEINGDSKDIPKLNNEREESEDVSEANKQDKGFQVNKENKDASDINKFDFLSGDWSNISKYLIDHNYSNFDLILSSETIYNVNYYYKLKDILQKHLSDGGVALFAAKKHYFGVGGGTHDFIEYFKQDGQFDVCIVETIDSCLIREILQVKKRK